MAIEHEVHQLRARVTELEKRLDQVFAALRIEAPPLPGSTGADVSGAVRALIAQNKVMQASLLYKREHGNTQELTTELVERIYFEETGRPYVRK